MSPNKLTKTDRREARRTPVEIWVEEKGSNYSCFHLASNLSRGGVRVEKRLPFKDGAVVNLEMELPGAGDRLKVQGRVIESYRDSDLNITGAGIMFINMSKPDQEKIDTYINGLENTEKS